MQNNPLIFLEKNLSPLNAKQVIESTNTKGADFLMQWAGKNLTFPLTLEQLETLTNIYSIFYSSKFIGIIQQLNHENQNIHIGRFLLDPAMTGKGIGQQALMQFCQQLFAENDINSISLKVFEDNISAVKAYQKANFEIIERITEPNVKPYFVMKNFKHPHN